MWLVREREREEELQKQNQNLNPETDEKQHEYRVDIWTELKYNTVLRGFILVLVISVIAPIIVMIIIDLDKLDTSENGYTCVIRPEYQIPCGPQKTTRDKCSRIKCCYNDTTKACYHYAPSKYQYTVDETNTNDKNTFKLSPLQEISPFGVKNQLNMFLTLRPVDTNSLTIILHDKSYKVENDTKPVKDVHYNMTVYTKEIGVEVSRLENSSDLIFATTYGPLVISEHYWEWTVDLKAEHLYGMDFFHYNTNVTITRVVYKNANDHSSRPVFMAFQNGMYHGLQVEHGGPLEVSVLPSRLIVLRLLSGNYLKLRLTTGPRADDVYRQQRQGIKEIKPPLWALGVHVCRDGTYSSIKDLLKEFNDFNTKANFPYDSDCIHENLFSITMKLTKEIQEAVKKIRDKKKRFIMSLAPQVEVDSDAFEAAEKLDILYKDATAANTIKGRYLNRAVAYPDYSFTDAFNWFKDAYTKLQIDPDAFVLRDNWPVNDDYKFEPTDEQFQFITKEIRAALSQTIPWNSVNKQKQQHINYHNLYGEQYAETVTKLNPNTLILSAVRGDDSLKASHVENIDATWVNYKLMLKKMLSQSLFAGSLYSVPVCGTTKRFHWDLNQETLCLRWYLTAATMPIFRLSSAKPRRDPNSVQDLTTSRFLNEAIQIRYKLLPYFYTILSESTPFVRPMFFNYPQDKEAKALDEQYMIGDGLLVAQPVLLGIPYLRLYLPKVEGGWYEFWGGLKYSENGNITLPILDTDLVMFIAAGTIIPQYYNIKSSVEETQSGNMKLAIALNCAGGRKDDGKGKCEASGKLHLHDTEITLHADEHSLQILNTKITCNTNFIVSAVDLYGIGEELAHRKINCDLCKDKLCGF